MALQILACGVCAATWAQRVEEPHLYPMPHLVWHATMCRHHPNSRETCATGNQGMPVGGQLTDSKSLCQQMNLACAAECPGAPALGPQQQTQQRGSPATLPDVPLMKDYSPPKHAEDLVVGTIGSSRIWMQDKQLSCACLGCVALSHPL